MSHRACPGSSSLAEDEHLRLQSEASTPYDPTNGAHLSLLRALWVGAGLGPGDEFEPVSTRWLSIGFQGADPSALHPPTPPTPSLQAPASSLQPLHPPASTPKGADPSTDLRGAGLLGLRQLLHFYRAAHLVCHDTGLEPPTSTRAGPRQLALLYSRARASPWTQAPHQPCPVASASLNITQLLCRHLRLQPGYGAHAAPPCSPRVQRETERLARVHRLQASRVLAHVTHVTRTRTQVPSTRPGSTGGRSRHHRTNAVPLCLGLAWVGWTRHRGVV